MPCIWLGRGKSGAKIKEILEQEAMDSTIYIAVDTLEYLKRGGRVTAAGAAIGTALNIKPVAYDTRRQAGCICKGKRNEVGISHDVQGAS